MLEVVGQWGRRISLPMSGPSRYWLRNAPGAGKYATVEALIFLYAALGLTAAEAALRLQFELHVYAGLRTRGAKALADELLATSPLRTARHVAEAVELFRTAEAATVVSVMRVPHRYVPSSLMRERNGRLVPYQGDDVGPTQRQEKATLFARNGPAVLIVRSEVVDVGRLYGNPTIGYEMDEIASLDVDSAEDLRLADLLIRSGWA